MFLYISMSQLEEGNIYC